MLVGASSIFGVLESRGHTIFPISLRSLDGIENRSLLIIKIAHSGRSGVFRDGKIWDAFETGL